MANENVRVALRRGRYAPTRRARAQYRQALAEVHRCIKALRMNTAAAHQMRQAVHTANVTGYKAGVDNG